MRKRLGQQPKFRTWPCLVLMHQDSVSQFHWALNVRFVLVNSHKPITDDSVWKNWSSHSCERDNQSTATNTSQARGSGEVRPRRRLLRVSNTASIFSGCSIWSLKLSFGLAWSLKWLSKKNEPNRVNLSRDECNLSCENEEEAKKKRWGKQKSLRWWWWGGKSTHDTFALNPSNVSKSRIIFIFVRGRPISLPSSHVDGITRKLNIYKKSIWRWFWARLRAQQQAKETKKRSRATMKMVLRRNLERFCLQEDEEEEKKWKNAREREKSQVKVIARGFGRFFGLRLS